MAELSDYLAAERTFLAWIRTGLALMGFGFVVARFGLFLQQIQTIEHASSKPSSGLSLWLGTVLIAAGIAINLLCAWRHVRLVQELDRGGQSSHSRSQTLAFGTAIFLASAGVAMAVYLLSVRGT
jgi:putative membrane protein